MIECWGSLYSHLNIKVITPINQVIVIPNLIGTYLGGINVHVINWGVVYIEVGVSR